VALVVMALAGWLGAAVLKRREARGSLDVPVAVMLPPILATLGGALTGAFHDMPSKYLSHAGPALAVASALPVAQIFASVDRLLPRLVSTATPWLTRAAPYALAVWIAYQPVPTFQKAAGATLPRLDFADLAAAGQLLTTQGFTWQDVTRIQSPNDPLAPRALRLFLPKDSVGNGPDLSMGILLLKLRSSWLPAPLPPGWAPVRTVGTQTTVVVPSQSWLDWRSFEAIRRLGGEDKARGGIGLQVSADPFPFSPVTLSAVPTPPFNSGEGLVLRVPLLVPAQVSVGEAALINLPGECPAALLPGSTGPESNLDHLSFSRGADASPPAVVRVVYASLGPCQQLRVPPLVIQGSPAEVGTVQSALGTTGPELP
jgi:hypothetical protein